MTTTLYEEAIADAKKIREVAEESAKKAILESVTPKIREFIENQILEQGEEKSSEVEKEEERAKKHADAKDDLAKIRSDADKKDEEISEFVELDESAISALMRLLGDDTEEFNNTDSKQALEEAFSRLSDEERQKLFSLVENNNSTGEKNNLKDIDIKNKENINMSGEQYYEVDLKALREAVDERLYEEEHEGEEEGDAPEVGAFDMDLGGEEGDDLAADDDDEVVIPRDTAEDLLAALEAELGGGEEPLDVDDDEEGEDLEALEEVFEVDPEMLKSELRRIRSLREANSLAHERGGIAKDMEGHFGGKGKKNAGVAGSFGGGKEGKDVLSEMRRVLRNQRRQNASLENKLTKYRSAVNTLREQLEELNLFNAKLLYVNKLLQNKSISESQKRSVVKALDAAKDLREAKVLYKSLTESFSQGSSSKGGTLTESVRRGGSSRTTKSASSTNASGEVDRWARLAGLK